MKSKQWAWIYQQIRKIFEEGRGQVPNDQVCKALFALYEYVGEVTAKSRQVDREIDEELRNIFNYLFDLFHSLETEGKEI